MCVCVIGDITDSAVPECDRICEWGKLRNSSRCCGWSPRAGAGAGPGPDPDPDTPDADLSPAPNPCPPSPRVLP